MNLHSLEPQLKITLPSRLQSIQPAWQNADRYHLFVKRDDLIHPIISGNKWRKLSSQLSLIANSKAPSLGSFGGGYSNHLHALSYCCAQLVWPLTAFVRGDYSGRETPMLQDIIDWGTRVIYLSKKDYQMRTSAPFCDMLATRYQLSHMIPEGGSHQDGLVGMTSLMEEFTQPLDFLVLPVASSGTIAGLAVSSGAIKHLIGIAVLKGQEYLQQQTTALIGEYEIHTGYTLLHDFHCGGYAKSNEPLRQFCQQFQQQLGIPLEPVYSGKTFYALKQLVEQGYFPDNSRIGVIHTGGLQGDR